MKRQKKQFLLLVIVLLLLLLAYIGIRFYNQKQEENDAKEKETETVQVTEIDTSEITHFSYQQDGNTLSFTKEGEDWIFDEDSSVSLDVSAIESMLSVAGSLNATEEITEYENEAAYGLDAPANTITLTDEKGTITLYLGNGNAISGGYYLKTSNSGAIYLVGDEIVSAFSKSVGELTAEADEAEETEKIEESTENQSTEEAVQSVGGNTESQIVELR